MQSKHNFLSQENHRRQHAGQGKRMLVTKQLSERIKKPLREKFSQVFSLLSLLLCIDQ
jgi:hypothetical protein